jgi:hypothetical protein
MYKDALAIMTFAMLGDRAFAALQLYISSVTTCMYLQTKTENKLFYSVY